MPRMAGVLPSANQPVLLLIVSLFVALELPREARHGTVVWPDYGSYCRVLCAPAPTLTRVEVWTWVADKMSVDTPDRLTSGGVLPICVASRVVVTTCRFYGVSDRGEVSQQRQGACQAEETGQ
ncbi:hypothetical protein Taro_011149 [Colocasia esculenta]|uniref:Uncharacterized protein n=1 Tax=Colocasia esculenta TaxID=4460 RepID=A0A843U920_COLES|nr:hypothetical protein [Colocasia esculenta]